MTQEGYIAQNHSVPSPEIPKVIEKFWTDREPKAREQFLREFADDLADIGTLRWPEGIDQEIVLSRMMEQERSFVVGTLEQVALARKENPNKEIVILFDIDETLLIAGDGGDLPTTFRPLLFDVLNQLRSQGVDVGLFSTRNANAMHIQINDPHQLRSLKDYVSAKYIYSTSGPLDNSPQKEAFSEYEQSEVLNDLYFDHEKGNAITIPEGYILSATVRNEDLDPANSGAFLSSLRKLRTWEFYRQDFEGKVVVVVDDVKFAG